MNKLEELKALLAGTLASMEKMNNENAEMTPEVSAEFTALQAKYDNTQRAIKLEGMKNVLAAQVEDVILPSNDTVEANAEYKAGFNNYLAGTDLNDAKAVMTEGVDAEGGYIVPQTYQDTVVAKLNALGATRRISTVLGTTSTTNIPTEGAAPTFTWVAEGGAYGQTDAKFGNKVLGAHKLGGIIKVSRELLQDTSINFDSYMAGQIALGIDKAESPAFAVGDGVNKPTGYSVSATVGASSTTAAVSAVTSDELIDIFYDLKAEYRKNATWRMNDSTLKAISKLKDGQGNYILGTLADGTTPTIKGRPVEIDNDMASMGTGNIFVVIGDFSSYQIADRGAMTVQRLDELYAGTGMVGFQVTARVDGKVIIGEAFNAGKNA